MKKIAIIILSVLLLAGCSSKRDMTFKTDKMEFENGKTEQTTEVEGKNIETYLPKIEEEYQPFVLGWVDEAGKDVDITNIPKKTTNISVKWDVEKLQDYNDTKELEETLVLMNKYVKTMNETPGIEFEFSLESYEEVKYIFITTIITHEEFLKEFAKPNSLARQKTTLAPMFDAFELMASQVSDFNDTKYPIATRVKVMDAEETVIYESLSGRVVKNILE